MNPGSVQNIVRILKRAQKVVTPEVQVFVVTITPEIAKELLQANDNIRALKKSVVARYAQDMQLGLWSLTGATVTFDWEGSGKDGQHRLQSCVESGEPFDTIVVVGVDPISSLSLDIGAKRGLHDFLRHEGYEDPKNLAASIRLAYQLIVKKVITQETFSPGVLMRWFRDEEHQGLVEDLKQARPFEKDLREMGTGLTRTYLAAIRYAASYVPGIDIEDVDAFYSALAGSGQVVNRVSPEYQLRTFLQRTADSPRRKKKDRIQQPERMAVTINALNLFIAGKEAKSVSAITWNPGGQNPEAFPQIGAGVITVIAAQIDAEEADGGGAA